MSKFSHSDTRTMELLDAERALDNGHEDIPLNGAEVPLRAAVDMLTIVCKRRGIPMHFITAGIHGYMSPERAMHVTMHMANRVHPPMLAGEGATLFDAFRDLHKKLIAWKPTTQQLADILGYEDGAAS